jgi:AcrR family transcriptional regulator
VARARPHVTDDAADVESAPDGRAARTARTRHLIADSLLELLEEGDLQPTAQRIADRAGISLRLIYHHFGDLESLFRATAMRQAERMAALAIPIPVDGPLSVRIAAFCGQRARMLEWITPVRRAALLYEPFSDELRRAREAFVDAGDQLLFSLFEPELERCDAPLRPLTKASLAAVTTWNSWDALRTAGHDPGEAEAVLRHMVTTLLCAASREALTDEAG